MSDLTPAQKAKATAKVWRNPWHFIAFGFGSGLLPTMPGTFGTLVAIPIYYLLRDCSLQNYALIVVVITVFGMWLSEKVSREIGIHDYPGMNFDEIVGFLVTMFAAPEGWFWVILGFTLFRITDIWKPGPIRWVDKHVSGGFGVVLDDILAAVISWLILQTIAWFSGYSVLI